MAEDATSDRSGGGSGGGYVHDPTDFDEGGGDGDDSVVRNTTGSRTESDDDDRRRTTRAYHPEVPQSESFGATGWGLVAAIFLAFVVVPVAILLVPYSDPFLRSLGLTWRDAYLTLPLVPAMLLAALAVLVAVRD